MSAPATLLRGRRRLPLFAEIEAPLLLDLPTGVLAPKGVHMPDRDDLAPRVRRSVGRARRAPRAIVELRRRLFAR